MSYKQQVLNYKENMIKDLERLVSYNSVFTEGEGYPFGKTNAECLNEALNILERLGLKTYNLDNYAGYGEIGSGDQLIGIIGHMDIVPVGEGWDSDPLKLTLKNNKLYGRGSSDDKGPMVAAMYALKILIDNNTKFNKRIRIIVGSNEETGSKCLHHYVEKEGHIDYGFTPDGSFPGIFGEKGAIHSDFRIKNSKLKNVKAGQAYNVVCNKISFNIDNLKMDTSLFVDYLTTNNIKYEINNNDITVHGVAGHASTPEVGVNAISYAMAALKHANVSDPLVDYYMNHIGITTDGSKASLNITDEYGSTTLNIGFLNSIDNDIVGGIDIRYPVTVKPEDIEEKFYKAFGRNNIENFKLTKPLFFDPESPMIKALVKSYQKITNDTETKPMVIGGGTYSKGINNCIAFGGCFDDENTNMHDANEFIKVDNLLLQCEIYIEAIKNLLEL